MNLLTWLLVLSCLTHFHISTSSPPLLTLSQPKLYTGESRQCEELQVFILFFGVCAHSGSSASWLCLLLCQSEEHLSFSKNVSRPAWFLHPGLKCILELLMPHSLVQDGKWCITCIHSSTPELGSQEIFITGKWTSDFYPPRLWIIKSLNVE